MCRLLPIALLCLAGAAGAQGPAERFGRGDLSGAIAGFRAQAVADATDSLSWAGWAASLLYAGRSVEALQVARDGCKLNPWDGDLHALRGWATLLQGDVTEGRKACGEALRRDPRSTTAVGCFAVAELLEGRDDAVRTRLGTLAADRLARLPVLRGVLALADRRSGRSRAALGPLAALIAAAPPHHATLLDGARRAEAIIRATDGVPYFVSQPPGRPTEVPLHLIGGAPFVQGTVEGRFAFHVGLGTPGTEVAVISRDLLGECCLKKSPIEVTAHDLDGRPRKLAFVLIAEVRVADYTVLNVPAVIDDLSDRYPPMFRRALLLPVDRVFARARITIDYGKKTFQVAPGAADPPPTPSLLRTEGATVVSHAGAWRPLQLGWAPPTASPPLLRVGRTDPLLPRAGDRVVLDFPGAAFSLTPGAGGP